MTGNVVAITITGNLAGNVAATNITGNLIGNVAAVTITGNLAGNVAATTITGNLAGNVVGNVSSTTTAASANVTVGANVLMNTSTLSISNTTAISTYNAGSVTLGNSSIVSAPQIVVQNTAGTTTVNSTVISTSNLVLSGTLLGVTVNATSLQSTSMNVSTANAVSYSLSGTQIANSTGVYATYFNGQQAAFYLNAGNFSGTLPYTTIPTNVINTTADFTRTGITTLNANLILGSSSITVGLQANGSYGTAGQVLQSNGTATYWSDVNTAPGIISSVVAGSGLTGGGTSGAVTLAIGAANGITVEATAVGVVQGTGTVVNTSGVHVNSTYIASLDANNASFLGTVAASNFVRLDASDISQVPSFRIIRNTTTGSDGMYIGYGSTNSGLTRIYSEGSTSGYYYSDASGNIFKSDGTAFVRNDSGTYSINVTGSAGSATTASQLAGVGASSYMRTDNAQEITAKHFFKAGQTGTLLNATGSLGGLELYSSGTSAAAFISFHRPGAFASYFGLDTDNQFAVGGWSYGAALGNMKVGSLGVGTAASGVAGEIRANNDITAFYSSDERLKTNIVPIKDALDKLRQITGVMFDWTDEEIERKGGEDGYFVRKHDTGIIAQDVQKVLPEVVVERDSGYLAVKYEKMLGLVIQAINELADRVDALEEMKK